MGKNKHSKDRMFLTATEWRVDYGGKKHLSLSKGQTLPFDHCALSLTPLTDPCCTPEVSFTSLQLSLTLPPPSFPLNLPGSHVRIRAFILFCSET
jgi:hypothetical protein